MKQIFSRQTSKGLLVVSHDCAHVFATLDGRLMPAGIRQLGRAIDHPLGCITHTIGGNVALFQADMAAIASAVALFEKRALLVRACDSGGAFPGSKEWKRAIATERTLDDFDAAHPEIVAALAEKNAREQAEVAARVD